MGRERSGKKRALHVFGMNPGIPYTRPGFLNLNNFKMCGLELSEFPTQRKFTHLKIVEIEKKTVWKVKPILNVKPDLRIITLQINFVTNIYFWPNESCPQYLF